MADNAWSAPRRVSYRLGTVCGLIAAMLVLGWSAMREARAQADPGHVIAVTITLTPATDPGPVVVVLTWQGTANPDADYEVWRRTPPDRSFQETAKYATVPANEREPDGSFTFVDPAPLSLPDQPCYMVGATVGGVPPNSFSPDVCIPTLPAAMASLTLTVRPGPDPGEIYVDGAGFAPGSEVLVQELTCAVEPCPDADQAVTTRAASDGRISTRLVPGQATGPRTIVAWERGWLPSQFPAAPTAKLAAGAGGAGLGYPLSTRTGVGAVDDVLAAIASKDPASVAALIQPYDITRGDGSHRTGIWEWQCGEVVRGENFEALTTELIGDAQALYAVYRSTYEPEMPRIFEAADYVAVFAGKAVLVPSSSGSMVGIKDGRIVSVAIHCGDTTPGFFIRDSPQFLVQPWAGPGPGPAPGPPPTGTGLASAGAGQPWAPAVAVLGPLVLLAAAAAWVSSRHRR